jgi:hypothetical protein
MTTRRRVVPDGISPDLVCQSWKSRSCVSDDYIQPARESPGAFALTPIDRRSAVIEDYQHRKPQHGLFDESGLLATGMRADPFKLCSKSTR